jgi:hypothetical protein
MIFDQRISKDIIPSGHISGYWFRQTTFIFIMYFECPLGNDVKVESRVSQSSWGSNRRRSWSFPQSYYLFTPAMYLTPPSAYTYTRHVRCPGNKFVGVGRDFPEPPRHQSIHNYSAYRFGIKRQGESYFGTGCAPSS